MYDVYILAGDPLMRLVVCQLISGNAQVRNCITGPSADRVPAGPAGASDPGASDPGASDPGALDAVVLDAVAILVAPLDPVVRRVCSRQRTLVMVPEPATALALAAVRAGAHAVVTTGTPAAEMRVALDVAAAGGLYLCSEFSRRLRFGGEPVSAPSGRAALAGEVPVGVPPALAPREMETLELIAGGLTHAETARRLGLAVTTVNAYLARIRAKLDAGNAAELTRKAIAFGLVR